jgi:acetylornithine deacetylase/succinyl-diaminopimelate desuccinylase-like protein
VKKSVATIATTQQRCRYLAWMDTATTTSFIDALYEESIVPTLIDYIRIPNKSPHYDPDWAEHGYMDQAVEMIEAWCRARPIEGLQVEVVRLPGRTPLLFMEVAGSGDDTVLLYGHLDKQPEMVGWREGLGPWIPVREGDRLYGRGGADDGYSAFASLTAIEALQREGKAHARCVLMIEACEESGSPDLPAYVEHLSDRIGKPSLVICLDSGAGNYDQLWLTTSLRGNLVGDLEVDILDAGVHSGDASGVVPSSFRIARQLLSRLEDEASGEIHLDALNAAIPQERIDQAKVTAEVLGRGVGLRFPFVDEAHPVPGEVEDWILNRTWRPALSVTGCEGLPAIQDAGNVLRPRTVLKLSLRLPPTCEPEQAVQSVRDALEADPPYGARVRFANADAACGWNAPPLHDWLANSIDAASHEFFGLGAQLMGEGGTIPFMSMLGDAFPEAQFVITGVLGPESNAHGPNEFLHIPTAKKLTACVARVLGDHFEHRG